MQTFVLPDAGRSINYPPNAPSWYDHAQQWLEATPNESPTLNADRQTRSSVKYRRAKQADLQ